MKIGADNLPDDPVLLKQMLLLAQGKVAQLQEQIATAAPQAVLAQVRAQP